ncbi:hypothetical protein [Lactobacillus helveticus]|uniref:hypothetical protein n=1 Tax=Lactobacillus helveticus TaxID=1587 RepID=UPI0021821BFE|nr:hypothetical protein [Lactobacillus helveticus]MCS8611920.1 hypothetical protein [Lactobacillus helveticus]MCT3410920.1 hypothetical protein [Lactobacillus helveticus]MCT3413005.1 hypothetical protein [Lactobacillus helveticus]MCT3416437.1 hypothetical protein [Lactobacillus helveticus]MCT3432415.1 hypothetical protein [Lactobacillus helveticus]
MTALNYNYTTYDDFTALAIKQPELGRRLVKEYGKEGNWMHNPLTVYQTVRDYAIYEVLEDKYALPFHDNEEAVLSLVDVNFNEYHLPSLFAYLDYNSLGYALVTNKYFYDFYDRRTGQVATSDEFEF